MFLNWRILYVLYINGYSMQLLEGTTGKKSALAIDIEAGTMNKFLMSPHFEEDLGGLQGWNDEAIFKLLGLIFVDEAVSHPCYVQNIS